MQNIERKNYFMVENQKYRCYNKSTNENGRNLHEINKTIRDVSSRKSEELL